MKHDRSLAAGLDEAAIFGKIAERIPAVLHDLSIRCFFGPTVSQFVASQTNLFAETY